MSLIQAAFYAFIAVAAGGLLLATLIAGGRKVPALLGNGHGLAGLFSLVLLFIGNLLGREATPALSWWAMGVLFGGLIGGLLLFRVLFRARTPLALVAVHASVGIAGIYLLYRAVI